jgi:hypothetical protein
MLGAALCSAAQQNGRSTSGLGHFRQIDPLPTLSALSASLRSRPTLRTAAIRRGVPIGDITQCNKLSLLDHLNGADDKRRRHVEADRLGGFQIDY